MILQQSRLSLATLSFITLSGSALLACSGSSEPEDASESGDGDGESGDGHITETGGSTSGGDGDGLPSGGASSGGSTSSGAAPQAGGTSSTGGSSGDDLSACENESLVWKTARKTHYTSYPDEGSEECIDYNGCMWAGWFAGCQGKQTEDWVESHNIAAVFPNFDSLDGHQICIRSGDTRMIVNVIDTCGDDDCDGCCTENQGANDALVDLESYTNERWGLQDGIIQWADLGPNPTPICN